mgnify:CR=1 FL=1
MAGSPLLLELQFLRELHFIEDAGNSGASGQPIAVVVPLGTALH